MRTRTTKATQTDVPNKGANRSPIAAALMLVLIVPIVASGQSASGSSPQGRNWAEIPTLPDWSGVWELTFTPRTASGNPPELTPKAAAQSKFFSTGAHAARICSLILPTVSRLG